MTECDLKIALQSYTLPVYGNTNVTCKFYRSTSHVAWEGIGSYIIFSVLQDRTLCSLGLKTVGDGKAGSLSLNSAFPFK
jgi:hypothetical protein